MHSRHSFQAQVKGYFKSLRDEAVESILQEAAEAFAIERAKKEVGYQVPSIEEIARACDPIGVMDVIDAFNLNSCDDTVIENFPTCSDSTTYFHSSTQIETMIQAEDVSSDHPQFHSIYFHMVLTTRSCCIQL